MIRENWRVAVLIVLLLASTVVLFLPGVGLGASSQSGPTNLQFGLDLSGGTRIRAPLVGVTAEGVDLGGTNASEIRDEIAAELTNVSDSDIVVRRPATRGDTTAIEVRANVTRSAFVSALDAAGVSYDRVRPGVTEETREQAVRIIRRKIDETGLADRTVQAVEAVGTGRHYILIEVPNLDRSEIIDLINTRGRVEVRAYHSVERNGTTVWTNRTVLTRGSGSNADDFKRIGIAQRSDRTGSAFVPVTISQQAAPEFQEAMVETGIAREFSTNCGWPGARRFVDERSPCLLVVSDGKVIGSFGMDKSLGRPMVQGTWVQDPRFRLTTGNNMTQARQLAINLRAGALPTEVNMDAGTWSRISASSAEQFKFYGLLTGLVAVFAVAGVVFLRYGNPLVAAPMVVTALSEVVILLGMAAVTGLALDLSHVAGFIAVIGTGVDDLIIIADEVMTEGEISGGRVFQNRFRKAFWIIGAAAATTVIAMSPLAVLQLGDLRGFAIVTILGVFIGVIVTRPAYGSILRSLMTER